MYNDVREAVDGLRRLRRNLAEQIERIDAALAQLGEGAPKTRTGRSAKPCCTKSEVITLLTGLLRDNRALSRSDLEELAKEKITGDLGKSLSGYAMRLKEALAEPRFTEFAPGQYRLSQGSGEPE